MIIKAKDWNSFDKEDKALLIFGMAMQSFGRNLRRKKGHSAK
ncbi:hypothetical protein [Bacillus norwichensis]|nr:hypothetical protein [Bacillus norwichensis]